MVIISSPLLSSLEDCQGWMPRILHDHPTTILDAKFNSKVILNYNVYKQTSKGMHLNMYIGAYLLDYIIIDDHIML